MTGARERVAAGTGGLLVLGAAVLWGSTGTARALAPAGASPLAVGAMRILIGSAALVLVARVRGGLQASQLRGWPFGVVAAGAVAIAAYQLAFFSAVAQTGVAVGTIIAIGSAPPAAGLLAWLVRGEQPGRRWLLATLLAVAGGGLLAAAGQAVRFRPAGALLALLAGAAYAVYALASKQLLSLERHQPVEVMAVLFAGGTVLLLPVLVVEPLGWLASPRGLLVALHLGLVATALAYALFARGLARVPVATAATLSLAEPLTAALIGVVVLGERLTLAGVVGGLLVLTGLAALAPAAGVRARAAIPSAVPQARPRIRNGKVEQ